ncbi:MAG: hypothetical protein P8Z30_09435 [Acidobacteriota bacterium]
MRTSKFISCLSVLLLICPFCAAQSTAPKLPGRSKAIPLTIKPGVPIRVALKKRVRIKHVGTPIEGRVVDPVYVFDQKVIPAGSTLLGRVAKIDPVSRKRRIEAIANGDLTPFHTAHIEFSTLVLKSGKRLPIRTAVSPGATHVVQLVAGGKKDKKEGRIRGKIGEARQEIENQKKQAIAAIKYPHKLKWLEGMVTAQLPFHRQFLPAGTQFTATLKGPLTLGTEDYPQEEMKKVGSKIPSGSTVHVWLATSLSSAKDHRGTPVEAVVSQPLFSRDHQLILPEGSRLEGTVTKAVPAHRLNRNGKLSFAFTRIELPHGATRAVEASLQAATVAKTSHLKLDSEGGAHAVSSKKKYLMPAIDVLLAESSFDSDPQSRAIQEGSSQGGDVAGGAIRGGVGFGLLGSLVAMAARLQPVTAGFAFYGAAMSVDSHILARGSQVVFPKDTPMEIRFGTHEGPVAPPKKKAPAKAQSIAKNSA